MSSEVEDLQLIAERDRLENAVREIHLALGGNGEWVFRSPAEPSPHSGDLSADSLYLARALVSEHASLLAACKSAKALIEQMRVPQNLAQAAEQIRQFMHLMRSLDAAILAADRPAA